MDKMQYPRGLIRYDTQNGLQQQLSRSQEWRRVLRPRVLIYGAILLVVSTAVLFSLVLRTPFKVDVVRDRAALARIVDDGRIENVYRLQIMNASERAQRYRIAVGGLSGVQLAGAGAEEVEVGAAAARWVPVAVQVAPEAAQAAGAGAHRIDFTITQQADADGQRWQRDERTTFIIPK
jgi:polyferredoxin